MSWYQCQKIFDMLIPVLIGLFILLNPLVLIQGLYKSFLVSRVQEWLIMSEVSLLAFQCALCVPSNLTSKSFYLDSHFYKSKMLNTTQFTSLKCCFYQLNLWNHWFEGYGRWDNNTVLYIYRYSYIGQSSGVCLVSALLWPFYCDRRAPSEASIL